MLLLGLWNRLGNLDNSRHTVCALPKGKSSVRRSYKEAESLWFQGFEHAPTYPTNQETQVAVNPVPRTGPQPGPTANDRSHTSVSGRAEIQTRFLLNQGPYSLPLCWCGKLNKIITLSSYTVISVVINHKYCANSKTMDSFLSYNKENDVLTFCNDSHSTNIYWAPTKCYMPMDINELGLL